MAQVSLRLGRDVATDDDLVRLSRLNPGYRFERSAAGEVVVSPPAGNESSRRSGKLYAQVERWSEAGGLGYTFESSAGFRMPDGSVLSPDVAWIARARYDALPLEERERFGPICPDLVIEVRSPSDDAETLLEKLARFRGFGTSVAILFDPDRGVTILDGSGARTLDRVASVSIAAGTLASTELVLDLSALYP